MANSVDVTFTIGRNEYVRAIRRHYRSQLRVTRDVVGGFVAIVGGSLLLISTKHAVTAWFLIVAGTVLLALVAYALIVLPSMLYRTQPKLRSEYRLRFDDHGIGFKTTDIDAQLGWPMYHSWLSDDEFYILYHGARELSVIPKRCMTADECERLTALLERKIGSRHYE